MPRRKRICPAGYPVHIVQRGNNRQICFAADADMARNVKTPMFLAVKSDGCPDFRRDIAWESQQ